MLTTALVLAALAGVLHVGIVVLESFLWTTPRARAAFSTGTVAAAEATRPMAYNQGYYNLFLAASAIAGVVVVAAGPGQVGWTLVYACASMVAATLVGALLA